MNPRTNRPSPALVVALIALFAALAGTGYAATAGSIDSRDIKNNSVAGKDVRNASITGSDVKDASLTPSDFKGSLVGPQGPAGPAGPPGADGTAGSGPAAYAEIDALGNVDPGSPSSTITSEGVSREASGTYCVELPFKPSTGAVSVNPDGGDVADDSIITLDLDPTSYVICPGTAEAEISNVDASAGLLQNDDFNVQFDR